MIEAGEKFGRLTAVKVVRISKDHHRYWLFHCDCGNTDYVATPANARSQKGCGCYRSEGIAQRTHGATGSKLYRTWLGMRRRCVSNEPKKRRLYGDRGIRVCDEWQDFTTFRDWAEQNGYSDTLEIDRIDNDRGYSPDNCRWATRTEQMRNLRSTHFVEWEGERISTVALAKRLKMSHYGILHRIKRGWSIERIVNTPSKLWRRNDALGVGR